MHPLYVEAETGRAGRVDAEEVRRAAEGRIGPGRKVIHGIDADDLAQAGWGVVWPEGGDPQVREALEPLVRHRQEQAGELFRELSYRPGTGPGQFLNRLRSGFGRVNPREVPYYLLLAGDPGEIPHGFQAGLDVPHAIGRLALSGADSYARYAERIIAVEKLPVDDAPRLSLFGPVHDGDVSTQQCAGRLASGLLESFSTRRGGQLGSVILGRSARRDAFLKLLLDPAAPLVLSACHGVMYPSGHPLQRELQGAMLCADWPGEGAVGVDDLVEPGALPRPSFEVARILFLFGCFSGGTPQLDSFDSGPRDQRRRLAGEAFTARLPQALLERHASAVIAHVDQTFTDAFMWENYGQIDVFRDCLAALLDGQRVGRAMESFADRYAHLAVELAEALDPGDAEHVSLGLRVWLAFMDARGLIILGDPAVRLARPAAQGSSGVAA